MVLDMKIKNQFPIVITSEMVSCKEYYVRYFEFDVVFDSDWYVQLRHPTGIELAFMLPALENQPELIHEAYKGAGVVLSFEVDDAESEYVRMKELGAEIIYDLKHEEWGQIHFMMRDPSGMIVDVVQQL